MSGYWQSTTPDKGIVAGPDGEFVADCGYSLSLGAEVNKQKAAGNAALIVKALNLYTDLLEALRTSFKEEHKESSFDELRRSADRLRKRISREAAVENNSAPQPADTIDESLVYSVPEAGALLGLSKNNSYLAAKRGDIPILKIGKLRRVPKAALHAMLVPTPEQSK